jgi:hypothetical protein
MIEAHSSTLSPIDSRSANVFALTWKNFATVDQVLDVLTERFNVGAPAHLTSSELQDWEYGEKIVVRLRYVDFSRAPGT